MVKEAGNSALMDGLIKLSETGLSIKLTSVKCLMGSEPDAVTVDAFRISIMAPGSGAIMEGITFEAESILGLIDDMVTIAVGLAEKAEKRMIIPTVLPTELELNELVRSVMKAAGLDAELLNTPVSAPERKYWILN